MGLFGFIYDVTDLSVYFEILGPEREGKWRKELAH